MTIPNRTFGVELEIKALTESQAAQALRDAGIMAEATGYTHRRSHAWKVLYDGSLTGTSCEVVSPVLSGEDGIEQVRKVAKALARGGARVDRQCGLHVHVGAADLTGAEAVSIVTRYARFESTIDTFMPPSRRGNSNQYCQSMSYYIRGLTGGRSFRTVREVASAMYGERYTKVNTQAFNRHQTIEFRQHSGTCNADKIENWIRFVLHFVEASRGLAASNGNGAAPRTRRPMGSLHRANSMDAKLDRVIRALRDAGYSGLTQAEIARIGGWGVASVPPYLTRLRQDRGCQIRKNRGTGRYVLRNQGRLANEVAEVAAETVEPARAARRVSGLASAAQDSVFNGIPADVVSFYEERRSELSGNA